jgi:site-specific DNA-methyltransferase (adenine-specific)|tara:strand:- start:70 stop:720 length:651 start_codon:yes stop_codon:yes gene_type:complete
MEAMKDMSDNQFDLAIVDPPYGIDIAKTGKLGGDKPFGKNGKRIKAVASTDYGAKEWDKKPPDKDFFIQLKRVSINQIIFGANHFVENIPNANSSCWIVWDKDNSGNFADSELAYTTFKTSVRNFKWRWNGMLQQNMKMKQKRIHPTEKPIQLYEWLLMKYAKEGDTILDTHLGSGSIAIACHNLGYDLTGYEIDKDYYKAAQKRIKEHQSQLRIL